MTVKRRNNDGARIMDVARRAVKNARRKWRHTSKEDAEEAVQEVAIQLLGQKPKDPIALATTIASRRFAHLARHEKVKAKYADRAQAAVARKASDEPTPSKRLTARRGRPIAKRFDTIAALKQAVRHECSKEFLEFSQQEWKEEPFTHWVLPKEDANASEREARRLFRALRHAMLDCSAFVSARAPGSLPRAGNTNGFLAWWIPEFIDPLLKHAALASDRDEDDLLDRFASFVSRWDSIDFLQLGSRGGRATGFLTDRELAVVSLLGGFFPPSIESPKGQAGKLPKPLASGSVLEAQKAAVRTARRRHGRLRDGISKALNGVAPMPKNARYVVQPCQNGHGKLIQLGSEKPFRTFEGARRYSRKRWPNSAPAEMEAGRSWWVWTLGPENARVATITLTDFSRNTRRAPAVPE